MTTPQTPLTVLRGAAQLLAGVPYLLDYRPERSLVLVGSILDRGRLAREPKLTLPVSMLLRVDLPLAAQADALAAQLTPPVARAVRDMGEGLSDPSLLLHLFLYDAADDVAQALVEACEERLVPAGAELHSVLLVRDGAYRSLLEDDCPEGCDVPGHRRPTTWQPLPDPAGVPGVAELVLEGRNPARRRADVAALVRRRDETKAAVTGVALGVLDLDPTRLDEVEAMRALGRWVCRATAEPTHRERAAIARSLQDRWVRDLVLATWIPDLFPATCMDLGPQDRRVLDALVPLPADTVGAVDRLLELAGCVPVALTPSLLTLAGCVAWRHGEGTVANEAVDLALEVDPGYRMAQLMQHALVHGVSPRSFGTAAAA